MSLGKPKAFTTSEMRHRVTIKQASTTTDSAGQKVIDYDTTRFASEPAKFEPVNGGQTLRGRQIEAGVIAIFTVNYRSGYSVTDRVVFQGENYGVHWMRKPDGIGRFLELHCKAAQT